MASGSGYGKVILFGEHFVVHGNHAVVSAIAHRTTAEAVEGSKPGVELVDNRPAAPGYKAKKAKDQEKSLGLILGAMGIDATTPIEITLAGDLYAASGVGASAAFCTAIARSLSAYFNMDLSDLDINRIAYQGEKGYHGKPSGVDNTASTYGGLLWFKKREGDPEHERIPVPRPINIVMANSGPTADTTAAVARVGSLREKQPEEYTRIARDAEELALGGRQALERYDLGAVGRLMDRNHELLGELGVSTGLLDQMAAAARRSGALGAKLTGGGMGGYMVALVESRETGAQVARALEEISEDITTLETRVG